MSEQAVDLRSTWTVLRRRSGILLVAGVVGALAGLGLLYFFPPAFTSTSVVLLPSATQAGAGRTGAYEADTQVAIATSSEILARAAQEVQPEQRADELVDRVSAEAPTEAILRIKADGPTSGQAEDLSAAVAAALVEYLKEASTAVSESRRAALQERLDTLTADLRSVNGEIKKAAKRIEDMGRSSRAGRADAAALSALTAARSSTVLEIDMVKKQLAGEDVTSGQVAAGAKVLQSATRGVRADLVPQLLKAVLGAAGGAVLLTALFLLARNRRDPKLRSRDEIADAVGIPVVTSLRARPPRSVRAWRELLRDYRPDSPDAWALRQLLHGLVADSWKDWPTNEGFVLVVVSVSGDDAGLAVGPQIASFAASNGIVTRLFAAQQHESATTLWAACSQTSTRDDLPDRLSVATAQDPFARVDLTIRLIVLDRDTPEPNADLVSGGAALLAVSSASVTRRNLADAVVAADRVGLDVEGIVVANPDPIDRTTGRLTPLGRPGPAQPQPPPSAITTLPGGVLGSDPTTPTGTEPRPAGKRRRSR